MQRFLDAILLGLAVVAALCILDGTSSLTGPIASQFGAGGRPVRTMEPGVYLAIMLGITVLMPLAMRWLVVSAAARGSKLLNIPNRDYWLAPERREQGVARIRLWFTLLPILMVSFGLAIHQAVMIANRSDPPRLPGTFFWILFCGFLALCALWGAGLYRAMRPPTNLTTGS